MLLWFCHTDTTYTLCLAEKHGWDDVKSLFQRYGGKSSRLIEDEQRGKLFGRAEASAQKAEQRREEKAKAQAEAAKAAMSENMNLLRERGEKIEELGDKATELNENAEEFGSLAAQLKAKVQAKKWYQL
jgi:vacuolar-type H+-ATPase subunit I/STV1